MKEGDKMDVVEKEDVVNEKDEGDGKDVGKDRILGMAKETVVYVVINASNKSIFERISVHGYPR